MKKSVLFKHNKIAYEAVLQMLEYEDRVAVVHPTGTGKSFIGFQLCVDHPLTKICWLSPSEYIFNTQIENFISAGGDELKNVEFYTYAKLMLMSDIELLKIQPQYIILDEFHRCGAEMWGAGVQRLLAMYSQSKVLGLSATAIRYLDNQRNMVDEIFEGNIASEMTLGEAIVRGILNPPKYVLSVFSYQKDLARYEHRAKIAKNQAVRDSAEQYLEALRRALEKADGLDIVFDKHMSDRTGRYIVFCANFEHMHEMIDRVDEWFYKVDEKPNVYIAYSNDPATSKAFSDFKKDNSDHLKLLFCIDMLNEGVHVDDVSGVILFRPTVSPIIYKQQIGRALSASKSKYPVIFDIVNNIENLYSIGAIEQEMQVAMGYYRVAGLDKEIVNEHFRIIDEVEDCKVLFDKLNETLTASWDLMYLKAKEYFEINGNLSIPKRYKTEEGYSLGTWLQTQRKVRNGEQFGNLDEKRIKKLDAIGMVWDKFYDISWDKNFEVAKRYYQKNGHLNVTTSDKRIEGVRLGRWLAQLRTFKNTNRGYLSEERIKALDEIGMIWDVFSYRWDRNYTALNEYYKKFGNTDVPTYYVTEDGVKLGAWCNYVRRARTRKDTRLAELSEEQIKKLDVLGFAWEGRYHSTWEKAYALACEYKKNNGNLDIPVAYISDDGCHLGRWIRRQKDKYETLSLDRKKKIDNLGLIIKSEDPWNKKFSLVEQYFLEHGNVNIPASYVVEGVWIARWLSEQVARMRGKPTGRTKTLKTLSEEQIKKLESVGISAELTRNDILWEEQYEDAKKFYQTNGNLAVPKGYLSSSGKNLGAWIQRQRKYYRENKLTEEQIKKLSIIGMVWEFDDPWEVGYEHAKEYFRNFGNLCVESGFVCEDGYRLGNWISNQRYAYSGKARKGLTQEQIDKLTSIGMVWSLRKLSVV